MNFSKFNLITENQDYEFENTTTQEYDTSAQIRDYLETNSEDCLIEAGNGGGMGVRVSGIQAIAVNGSIKVDLLPADD